MMNPDHRGLQPPARTMARVAGLACRLVSVPVLLNGLGCDVEHVPADASAMKLVQHADHDAPVSVREPMVIEHPDGTLFVAGYTQAVEESVRPPKLFMSTDSGVTWSAVNVGSPEDGAIGNSDVDLAVAPDGTIFFLTMGFDRATAEGTHIAVGVSRDAGLTWSWTTLSRDRLVDRPWIRIGANGMAHVIWNDGRGVRYVVSSDGGRTWSDRARIHDVGGSSHLAIAPDGSMAVRITPRSASGNQYDEGVDLLAVSADTGRTWTTLDAPGTRDWNADDLAGGDGVPRWVEPVAWDDRGMLYHLWSEGTKLVLGRSTDRGRTWATHTISDDSVPIYYPYLIARGDGELAASWHSGTAEQLRVHVAHILVKEPAPPVVRASDPLTPDSWRPDDGGGRIRAAAGEYVPVIFLADSTIGTVLPIQYAPDGRNGFSWYRFRY